MPEEQTDLWTAFLDWIAQFIIPDWSDPIGWLPLIFSGLVVLTLAFIFWKWRQADTVNRPRLRPVVAPSPPPGVHLPGPSAWPFFVPVGLTIIFLGLVFNGWLVLLGILVSLLPLTGWLRDGGFEFRQVDAGHPPEPRTRDPARAIPRAAVGAYAVIAALTLAGLTAPRIIAIANPVSPSPSASPSAGPGGPPTTVEITASNAQEFDTPSVTAAAAHPLTIHFVNSDTTAPHNVAIHDATPDGDWVGLPLADAGATADYQTPPLPAGQYTFFCSVHPNMEGTLTTQ
jgi:plastocyanin